MSTPIPVQVLFCNMAYHPAVESKIVRLAHDLASSRTDITNCRVIVRAPTEGCQYQVEVELKCPAAELLPCAASPTKDEDLEAAVEKAFKGLMTRIKPIEGEEPPIHNARQAPSLSNRLKTS